MKSMFTMGFRPATFSPIMGQEFITSYDQGLPAEPVPNLYTSYDQGPPAEPVPGLVTTLPTDSGSSTDWGKIIGEAVKSGAGTYGAYNQGQIAQAAQRAKAAGIMPSNVPVARTPGDTGINPNVIFIVGGLALAGLVAVIAAG
jgi:hypothetical protein